MEKRQKQMNSQMDSHSKGLSSSTQSLSSIQEEMAAMREQIAGLANGTDGMKEMVEKQMADLKNEVSQMTKNAFGKDLQEQLEKLKK